MSFHSEMNIFDFNLNSEVEPVQFYRPMLCVNRPFDLNIFWATKENGNEDIRNRSKSYRYEINDGSA